MKKLVLFLLIGTFVWQVQAQSTPQEIGIRVQNLRDFGLMYKKQLQSGKWLRTSLGGASFSLGTNNGNFGLDGSIGLEKRTPAFNNELIFQRGPSVGFGLGLNWGNGLSGFYNASFSYPLALAKAFPKLMVSLEVLPTLRVNLNGDNISLSGFIDSSPLLISVLYRIGTEKE